jgi:hypothetical protein
MKKMIFLLFLLVVGREMVIGQPSNTIPAGAYCFNATAGWIPVASAAGTVSPSNPPGMALYGFNNNQWYALACDANGNLAVTASGGTIAAGTAGQIAAYSGSTAIGAISEVPIANLTTNPSTVFFVNSNSSYSGTPDGSPDKPYTSFSQAYAAMTQAKPYVMIIAPWTTYADLNPTFPSNITGLKIYGNQATYTIVSGTLAISCPTVVFYLFTSGAITSTSTWSRYGGSLSGNLTITGTGEFRDTVFIGAVVIGVGSSATVSFNSVTLAGTITSLGSGSTVIIKNHSTLTNSLSSPNINMSAGGKLSIEETNLTNGGSGSNINCADGATSSTANFIGDGTIMNNGISCGTAYTYLSPGAIVPSVSGSAIYPTTQSIFGPATAPSGSCSPSGVWVFSQDGHATACISGTWTTKI